MKNKFQKNDVCFLDRTSRELFRQILERKLPYRCDVWQLAHNFGLKIERARRAEWQVGGVNGRRERVDVHFDARNYGEICLDVEVDPYETKITAERLEHLERHNVPRVEVMSEIRSKIVAVFTGHETFLVTTDNLRRPETPNAQSAVTFMMNSRNEKSPEDFASFCIEVLEEVGPHIDDWIAQNIGRWPVN